MPLDYEGTTNEFKDNRLIPPELQSIIDKITSSSSSISPRQRTDLTHLAGTIGGLQQQRQTETGQMARLGITGAQDITKLGITDVGSTERQKIVSAPGIMQQTRANLPVPGVSNILKNFQAGGIGDKKTLSSGLMGSEEDPLGGWSENWIR